MKYGFIQAQQDDFPVTVLCSKHALPVAENVLNRGFTPTEKNRVWTTDITYIWTLQGRVYLAVVIDLYSRRVAGWLAGWHLDCRMETTGL
ncbi:DDE-type integrase/transposase/recombinase [Solemya elarraichensis gill symbiont]|uniref:Integrase catalytic domain-containing protein n=1 Tax=Solemya elarraichensis gill symbiont TaxID=1918949 RepID=A0A1T2KYY3_9GAMM|nr:DDE-type integrase/transposase/recombinase [Solemya elarraichensis gill symbiont]OOZ38067.1 hypothetical protein BOW52_09435 [Solemya elarraichensis gill symbiont]